MSETARLRQGIKIARRDLLDFFQGLLGHSPSWTIARAKILRTFGTSGMEGLLREQSPKPDGETNDRPNQNDS